MAGGRKSRIQDLAGRTTLSVKRNVAVDPGTRQEVTRRQEETWA